MSTTPARTTRNTWQKRAITELMEKMEDFVSAQDLHQALSTSGKRVSLATVYRVLQSQVDEGLVDMLPQEDGEALFRQCETTAHHHHLICRTCRATVEIQAPQVERWADEVAAKNGYTEVDHTLEIYGLCAQCTAAQN